MENPTFIGQASNKGVYVPDYPNQDWSSVLNLVEGQGLILERRQELNQPVSQKFLFGTSIGPVVQQDSLSSYGGSSEQGFDLLNFINDDRSTIDISELAKTLAVKDKSEEIIEINQAYTLPLIAQDLGVQPVDHHHSNQESMEVSSPAPNQDISDQTSHVTQPEDNHLIIEHDGKIYRMNDFEDDTSMPKDDLKKDVDMTGGLAADFIQSYLDDLNQTNIVGDPSQPVDDFAGIQIDPMTTSVIDSQPIDTGIINASVNAQIASPVSMVTYAFDQCALSPQQPEQPTTPVPEQPSTSAAIDDKSDPRMEEQKLKRRIQLTSMINEKLRDHNINSFEDVKKLKKDTLGQLTSLLIRFHYHSDKSINAKGIYKVTPSGWPRGLYFGDPSNGKSCKKGIKHANGAKPDKKPGKPEIIEMCRYLYTQWKGQEMHFKEVLP